MTATPATKTTALEAARLLERPEAVVKMSGDVEAHEWWEEHAALLEEARKELGQKCASVYSLHEKPAVGPQPVATSRWLRPETRQLIAQGSLAALLSVAEVVGRDDAGFAVYRVDLFTDEFCDLLLAELDALEASGIPLRRPNGMNRFGAILSQLGFQKGLLDPLMHEVIAPLSQMLWPEWVAPDDAVETYGFVVRYRLGEDTDLAEHSDTSNVTANVCLGREFEGGDIYFKGVRMTSSENTLTSFSVGHRKGSVLLHLGGHRHGVQPLVCGERSNLILWGTAECGRVRIVPVDIRCGVRI